MGLRARFRWMSLFRVAFSVQTDIILAISMLVIIWLSINHSVEQRRQQIYAEAVNETSSMTIAFEENVSSTIHSIDQMLIFLRSAYEQNPNGFNLKNWNPGEDAMPRFAFQIAIVGPDGNVIMSSLPSQGAPVSISSREHFQAQLKDSRDFLFIGKPLVGFISHKPSIQFTRKIRGPNGQFGGVVVVSLDPIQMSKFYQTIKLGSNGIFSLATDDGVILARSSSGSANEIGVSVAGSELWPTIATTESGTLVSVSPLDGKRRVLGYRHVSGLPLVIWTGLDERDILAPLIAERDSEIQLGIYLSLLVVAVAALSAWHRLSLNATKSTLQATMDSTTQGIIMVDADRRVRVMNRRTKELLDIPHSLSDKKELYFDDLVEWQRARGEFGIAQQKTIDQWLSFSQPLYERQRLDGTWLEIRTTVLPDGSAVRTFNDITERKRTEVALREARDAAEDASRARSAFIAMMSHEIRTPMNAVIGMSGLLIDSGLEGERKMYAETIRDSGEHLMQILNDILDFSRLDANKVDFETLTFDIRHMVRQTLPILQGRANQKNISLNCNIADDVPSHAIGDPGRIRQILLNLIGNAIKFTETGGVRIDVSVVNIAGSRMRLGFAVIDTGIGMAPEAMRGIFSEFWQADRSVSRRFGGTGLGLAICKQLVERMDGTISVVSEPGKGSTFSFEITLSVPEAQNIPVESDSARIVEKATERSLRILLAEDNASNVVVATAMLKRLGHRVDCVANGREAVEAIKAFPYDLIFMDVQMPVMDGMSAARAIRSLEGRPSTVPIVALTANAFRKDIEDCLAAGMNGHASKPITQKGFAEALAKYAPKFSD